MGGTKQSLIQIIDCFVILPLKDIFNFFFNFKFLNWAKTTMYFLMHHTRKDRIDKVNRNPNLNFDGEKKT